MSKDKLLATFESLAIAFESYQHPPLDHCQAADELNIKRAGQRTKNLFLRDNYGRRHFLLITTPQKSVDLKALSRLQEVSRIGFASAERLQKYLAVRPGSVSLLSIINDENVDVELWVDQDISLSGAIQCHPLTNEQTWVISGSDILAFLTHIKRDFKHIAIPEVTTK